MQNNKLLIGISGGIGSGKTLASSFLESYGYKVIYADKVAKELYRTNRQLKAQIVKEFGKGVLDSEGNIAGAGARKLILADKKNIKRVNRIVHPFVRREIVKKVSLLNDKIIFIEAAIMFDTGYYKQMDYTLLIYAPQKLRINRVHQRDKITKTEVMKLMSLQMDEGKKLNLADFIIKNNGTERKFLQSLELFIGLFQKHLNKIN